MTIDRKSLERLEKDAGSFDSKNHQGYLAQALECVRETQDPVEALILLEKMFGSSFGGRPNERKALNDVGKWLEARLAQEPPASAERIALELGWLRRMAVVVEAEATKAQKDAVVGSRIAFGSKIPSIVAARKRRVGGKG